MASWRRVPRGHLGARLVGLEVGVPAVGQAAAGHPAAEVGRLGRVGVAIGVEARLPLGDERLAGRDGRPELLAGVVRDVERAIRIPAVGLLGQADLVGPERRAVRLLAVVLVRAAVADVGADGDEARPVVGQRRLDGAPRSRRGRCRPRRAGCASRRHRTASGRPPTRPSRSGRRAGCGCRRTGRSSLPSRRWPARLAASDAMPSWRSPSEADDVRPVVDDRAVRPVELVGEPALRDGHPDRVREALAERSGRRLDAGRQAVLGVARGDAAPLAERLEVLERDAVAGQVEERVEQHAGVAGGQDEPVAIGPVRVGRGVAQEPRPQDVGHRRGAHRGARVARSWPSGRRRWTGSGWCRWTAGRGPWPGS